MGCWRHLRVDDQEFTLEDTVEIRKQSGLEEEEKPQPEPREKTLTVSKFTKGIGMIDAGVEVLEDIEWKVSSSNWSRRCENAWLIWEGSEGEEEVFVSADFADWFIQTIFRDSYTAIFVFGYCRW